MCGLLTSQIQTATLISSPQKGWNETGKGTEKHDTDPELFTYA